VPNAEDRTARRSERSRRAILDATYELLDEVGYRSLTVEAIAARAKVGKQTIYRWWGSKTAVVLEVFLERSRPAVPPDGRTLGVTLRRRAERFVETFYRTPLGRNLGVLLGEAQSDDELREALVEQWFRPRREPIRKLLLQAQDRGEVKKDIDVDSIVDALYGPLYYRTVFAHAPVTKRFINEIVNTVLSGITCPRPATGAAEAAESAPDPSPDPQRSLSG
jgi:AcrR family transcriptional regulator